jgi:hypothetical protein
MNVVCPKSQNIVKLQEMKVVMSLAKGSWSWVKVQPQNIGFKLSQQNYV